MSGGPHHNPHGRQGQLGAGWSHLQVPEYFPRHPLAHLPAAHLGSERPTWHTPAPLAPPTLALPPSLYRHGAPDDKHVLKGGAGAGSAIFRHTPTPPDRDMKSYRHTPTPPDKIFGTGVIPTDAGAANDGRRCAPSPLLHLQQAMAAAAREVDREHYADSLARNLREEAAAFARRSPAAPGSMDLSPAARSTAAPANGEPRGPAQPQTGLSVRDAGRINSLLAARAPPWPLGPAVGAPAAAPSVIVSAPAPERRRPEPDAPPPRPRVDGPEAAAADDGRPARTATAPGADDGRLPRTAAADRVPAEPDRLAPRADALISDAADRPLPDRKSPDEKKTIEEAPADAVPAEPDVEPNPPESGANPAAADEKEPFVEVESALEMMFAGLEETAPAETADSRTDRSETVKSETAKSEAEKSEAEKSEAEKSEMEKSEAEKSEMDATETPARKTRARARRASLRSSDLNSSEEATPARAIKKKMSKKETQAKSRKLTSTDAPSSKANRKESKLEAVRRDGYDSGSNASSSRSRGPYVQIKGPRDSPISVQIVNAPLVDDDADGSIGRAKATKVRPPVDVRDRIKSKGLHSSTLGMKYDSVTPDPSWMCVFCKRGSHSGADRLSPDERPMGDLFGPYTITKDCEEHREMLLDPHDLLFKTRPKKRKNEKGTPKKEKDPEPFRTLPQWEIYAGMSGAEGGAAEAERTLEVWTHEDCAVWAPAVRLAGGRLLGLEAAAWAGAARACDGCARGGAALACSARACRAAAHVPCARAARWRLRDADFRAFCAAHAPPPPPAP